MHSQLLQKINAHRPLVVALLLFGAWRFWAFTWIPFFQDSPKLLMEPALWILKHGLGTWLIPPHIMAEPPLAPWLLALIWKCFGVSLWSVHLLISFFTLGAVYQLYWIVQKLWPYGFDLSDKKTQFNSWGWILAPALIESTWLAHSLHLSPDLILVFLALWGIRCILDQKWSALAIPLLLLSMLSVRGTISVMGLGLGIFIQSWVQGHSLWKSRQWWQLRLIPFIPALLASIVYWISRKLEFGHFYFDPQYIALSDRSVLPISGMLRNIAVLGFRFTDMGRIFYWIAFAFLAWKFRSKLIFWIREQHLIISLLVGIFIAFIPFTIPFSNPFGPRYFLIQFILGVAILSSLILRAYSPLKAKTLLVLLMGVSFMSHWIIPPVHVARGWDSTLAISIYFKQVDQAKSFFESQNIPLDQVGFDHTQMDLNKDPWRYRSEDDRYILISHVQNPSDLLLDSLQKNWIPIADFTQMGLWMKAYQKKD